MTVHVVPVDDLVAHEDGLECPCGPDVEWTDPDTGGTYPDGPLVTHHALDGRA